MSTRESKEMKSLFQDPKFSRQAWRSVGQAILQNPATYAPVAYDNDGNMTIQSAIENYSYEKLCKDIKSLTKTDRKPTELEMILQCQIVRARFDTNAATFVRDTLGAKPVDESKIQAEVSNPYEMLTDEELELLEQHRQLAQASTGVDVHADAPTDHIVEHGGDDDASTQG